MKNYEFTLSQLDRIWNNHEENGIRKIRLIHDATKNKLTVECLCTDDCEPYWSWNGEYDCTIENYTLLLSTIINNQFIDDYGQPRPVLSHVKEGYFWTMKL